MSAYVHDQSIINERRMKEMEDQARAANEAALAAQIAASTTPATETLSSSTTPESNLGLSSSTTQPLVVVQGQQDQTVTS